MSVASYEAGEARVRWWVAGAFSVAPAGARWEASPDAFTDTLARALAGLEVEVPDLLGAAEHRRFALALPRLRALQLGEVVAAVPELKALRELADGLGRAASADLAGAARTVEALVGEGRLSRALKELAAPAAPAGTPPARTETAAAGAGGGAADRVDALFAQTSGRAPATGSGSALDAFIRAGRPAGSTAAPSAVDASRRARTLLEEAVFSTAASLLAALAVQRLESAWRSLKLLVDQCPRVAGMSVTVVDVEEAALVERLEALLPEDPFERPDAVFVLESPSSLEALRALAELGERWQLPVVTSVSPGLLGAESLEALVRQRDEGAALPEGWRALAAEGCARWLTAAMNPPVVASDGAGKYRRAVLGSAALGLGAMLAASYREVGSFGRVLGPAGGLRAPALHEDTSGGSAVSVPTARFLSIRAQSVLAGMGVAALGSARNSDVLVLSAAPTVFRGEDMASLPGQLVAGRIVRFALWVRDQLPPGVEAGDVRSTFEQAAHVFLFGGAESLGRLTAELVSEEDRPAVQVDAQVPAAHAGGAAVQLRFSLPLRV